MSNDAKILLVGDEPQVGRTLRAILVQQGYIVSDAANGEEAVEEVRTRSPEVVLLDLNMPSAGGLATCRAIRESSQAAIIVITVRGGDTRKVEALDAGADDYITKPFSTTELLARIRAALRRLPDKGPSQLMLDGILIDFRARRVLREGHEIRLTPKEYDVLQFLTANANEVIPHRKLLQAVWGPEYGDEAEYLRVVVNQLRKKIERDAADPRFLLTEPWIGYRFRPPP